MTVNGTAHIILADGCELTCPKGITVMDGAELYIYGQTGGTGKLTIKEPKDGNAGLGGVCKLETISKPGFYYEELHEIDEADRYCGVVNIHGGKIEVSGSRWSSAIGGGWMQSSCRVTIFGGEVTANGGQDGPGIGSGCFNWNYDKDYLGADTGWTKIYGGTVTATGGEEGAGIGGAPCRHVGKIEIFGGVVWATGGNESAGIGGGGEMDGSSTLNTTNTGIFIHGGEVHATGGERAAGIGGGYGSTEDQTSVGDGGNITITGGTVTAQGGKYGAGIGGSIAAGLRSLTISGGSIVAYGGDYGAGIGAGEVYSGKDVTVNISGNAYVEAHGGTDAAGIGIGEYDGGAFSKETGSNVYVTVSGGRVFAYGNGSGAGIGGGEDGRKGGYFAMTGGTVVAKAGDDCKGAKDGCGSAIGCGDGVNDKGNHLERCGTFNIASGIKATGANDNEVLFPADDRVGACIWSKYVRLEACTHGTREYKVISESEHSYRCVHCGDDEKSTHTFTNGTCVCGMSESGSHTCLVTIYRKSEGLNETYNLSAYTAQNVSGFTTQEVVMGSEFELPAYYHYEETSPYMDLEGVEKINGYTFDGWQISTTAPTGSTNCMKDANETVYDEGRLYTIPQGATAIYVCPRYRYSYAVDHWEWASDFSSATAIFVSKSLQNKGATETEYKKAVDADVEKSDILKSEVDDKYFNYYLAIANYDNEYKIDTKDVEIPNLVILDDDGDNSTKIVTGNDKTVYLEDRTLFKNDAWNTLCLPFSLSNFAGTPLEGAIVKEFVSATFNNETGTLTLDFTPDDSNLTSIVAGKPYIVKWAKPTVYEPYNGENEYSTTDLYSPTFWGVSITTTTAETVESTAADFVGQFASKAFTEADNTVLYVGSNNTLYYPDAPMAIGAQRAYFKLKGITAGVPATGVRSIVLSFGSEETGIGFAPNSSLNADEWYDLSGRKLSGKPTVKGLYINYGRKVVVK